MKDYRSHKFASYNKVINELTSNLLVETAMTLVTFRVTSSP